MKSFVTHDFVLSKDGALRRNVCGVCNNQKQELPVAAMFVNGSGRNEQSISVDLP
jgi:hypothetical protein